MYGFTAAALVLAASSVSAFIAPSTFSGVQLARTQTASSVATHMSAEGLIGDDVETFSSVFDPAGFAKDESKLEQYRAAELKHGRVAMLGVLGLFVQSFGIHLPDPVFSESKPIDAFFKVITERPAAALQVLAAITWIELVAGKQSDEKPIGDVGNFGDNFKPADEGEYAELQLKELKNGRLAMVSFFGVLVQEALTGQNIVEQLASGHVNPFGDGQGFF